jgi:hypothetical protein
MSLLTSILQQDALIITVAQDKYGDQLPTTSTSVKCRFRYITEVDKNSHMEGMDTNDAIIWFEPDANIAEGSIVEVDGLYWRIDRLIKARRMSGNTVEFLKAFVKSHQLAGELS